MANANETSPTAQHSPRPPTGEELLQLKKFLIDSRQVDPSCGEDPVWPGHECIAVFEDFTTDGPGYAGTLMVVVYAGCPEQPQAYIWSRNGIQEA